MRNRVWNYGRAMVAVLTFVMALSAPGHALTRCRAIVRARDGVILVSANQVGGSLSWGAAQGQETNAFSNGATCVSGSLAKNCELGALGTPQEITPPQLCRVFLSDGVGSCSALIHGCTPGVRDAVPGPQGPPGQDGAPGAQGPPGPSPVISYVTCTGTSNSGGGASSSCTATCPANTKIVSGVCANDTASPQFAQGQIADPGTNTMWSCLVKNQNSASGAIAAQGTAICLPQS